VNQAGTMCLSPTAYGMYSVSAAINDIEIKAVNLTKDFDLDVTAIKDTWDQNTKLLPVQPETILPAICWTPKKSSHCCFNSMDWSS